MHSLNFCAFSYTISKLRRIGANCSHKINLLNIAAGFSPLLVRCCWVFRARALVKLSISSVRKYLNMEGHSGLQVAGCKQRLFVQRRNHAEQLPLVSLPPLRMLTPIRNAANAGGIQKWGCNESGAHPTYS